MIDLLNERGGNAVSTMQRVHVMPAVLLFLALAALACDARPQNQQPASEEARGDAQPGARDESPAGAPGPEARGRSFALPAGSVTIRRAGFDTLRIVDVELRRGWRRQIEDNFDESVGIEFFMGRRSLDFGASLENGRLFAETCREISPLSARPAIEDAATVALQRIGDDDLHVSVVRTSPGWVARIIDNNSDDVEVLVRSGQGRLEFDAQLDDGRLEGTICRALT
jgi:hypothetical protein